MLQEFFKTAFVRTVGADYPHLQLPAVVYGRVMTAAQLPDTFEDTDLVIYNDETGRGYQGHIVAHWYEYRLTVLDRFGNPDTAFPALPGIKSKSQFQVGAVVAVALPYGELSPNIIGEVVL